MEIQSFQWKWERGKGKAQESTGRCIFRSDADAGPGVRETFPTNMNGVGGNNEISRNERSEKRV